MGSHIENKHHRQNFLHNSTFISFIPSRVRRTYVWIQIFSFIHYIIKIHLKKKLTMPNTGKDREQLKRSYSVGWKQNDTSPLYKRLAYDPARKKKKKTSTQKPYMNVYCSFICNCPKAGNNPKWRTPFSIQWMNGKIIVHLHYRILLSDLWEWTLDTE